MQCHKIKGFIDKACRAGVERVFMGLENINPDNLIAADKRQNKITEYRKMMQHWRKYGTTLAAGYILGFPERHPRKHPARHRDHQARTAARSAGVLLPDAAARVRRSPGYWSTKASGWTPT